MPLEKAAEVKHTPGPWAAERHANPKMGWDVYAPDNSEYAEAGDLKIVAGYCEEANAYLIAVAPELLQALRAARELVRGTEIERRCSWVAETERIIAKATGGA